MIRLTLTPTHLNRYPSSYRLRLAVQYLVCLAAAFSITAFACCQARRPSGWQHVLHQPSVRFSWSIPKAPDFQAKCVVELTTDVPEKNSLDMVVSYDFALPGGLGVKAGTKAWSSHFYNASVSPHHVSNITVGDPDAEGPCLGIRKVIGMPPRPYWHDSGEVSESNAALSLIHGSAQPQLIQGIQTQPSSPQSVGGGTGETFVEFVWQRHDRLYYAYPKDANPDLKENDDSNPYWADDHICEFAFRPVNVTDNRCIAINPPYTATYRTWNGETKTATPWTLLGRPNTHLACNVKGQLTGGSIYVSSGGALGNVPSGEVMGGMGGNYDDYVIDGCKSLVTVSVGASQMFECGNGNPQGCNVCWPVGDPNPCNQQQPGGNIAH